MAHMEMSEMLVREFLAWRGFNSTLKSFENECRNDKNKNFRADRIIESITNAINNSDLQELRDIWKNLDTFFFSKLEHNYSEVVKKLETGVLKYYLVHAYNSNRTDKIQEFFSKMASEIHSQADFRDWFYFQYCKNPEDHPNYIVYFTKQWQDTLILSLHNFLATIFHSMPSPILMRTEAEASTIKKLQEENTKLRQRLQANLNQQQGATLSSHQSRQQMFYDKKTMGKISSPNDIIPFDVQPPAHLSDDFFIIATETLSMSEKQSRGFKSMIRNISSGSSPDMGRKDGSKNQRSGSVGSSARPSGSGMKFN